MICYCDYYLNIIFHHQPDSSLSPCSVIQYVEMCISRLFCSVILPPQTTLLFYCTSVPLRVVLPSKLTVSKVNLACIWDSQINFSEASNPEFMSFFLSGI